MDKLAYFLGGVIAGAVTLGVVAWYVTEHDNDSSNCALDDEDDGCMSFSGNAGNAEHESESATQPA
ncbi:MAG: hypothetical protein IJR87_10785 [Bacteroidaceae bacterium]|nr:hypothetical protein [Bacteroidaceae bacterium]